MSRLLTLRMRLDEVDRRLLDALAERIGLIGEVARTKGEGTEAPRDDAREAELLARLEAVGSEAGLDGYFVRSLYRLILDHSVRMQQEHLVDRSDPAQRPPRLVVGYQGTRGAYSQLAGERYYSAREVEVTLRGFDSFRALLEAVRDGVIDEAILPIENTTAGSIHEGYDLLAELDLALVGEEVWKVEHVLLAPQDVPLSHIRRIRSHPQALAQCSRFLRGLGNCVVEAYTDTAMACQVVGEERDLSQAAIASEEAGRLYGLRVIQRDIANQPHNYTRFVVVAREPVKVDARVPCRTSVIFATRHEEGALLRCLNALATRRLNLTKLESRPRPGRPWEYLFYVDFEGNRDEPAVAEALDEVKGLTGYLKILGTYPAVPRPREQAS